MDLNIFMFFAFVVVMGFDLPTYYLLILTTSLLMGCNIDIENVLLPCQLLSVSIHLLFYHVSDRAWFPSIHPSTSVQFNLPPIFSFFPIEKISGEQISTNLPPSVNHGRPSVRYKKVPDKSNDYTCPPLPAASKSPKGFCTANFFFQMSPE